MKLEMRVYDLDVKLELNDNDNFDTLEILQGIKNLLDELENFDNVNLSIVSVVSQETDEDLFTEETDDVEVSVWSFTDTEVDSTDAEVQSPDGSSDTDQQTA